MKVEVLEVVREKGEVKSVRLQIDCWETKWVLKNDKPFCEAKINWAGGANQIIPTAFYNKLFIHAVAILREKKGKKGWK